MPTLLGIELKERQYDLVRSITRVLVERLSPEINPITYKELSKIVHTSWHSLGTPLMNMYRVLSNSKYDPPILNAMVVKSSSHLPSDGLGNIDQRYNDVQSRHAVMEELNSSAARFTNWDYVLNEIGA